MSSPSPAPGRPVQDGDGLLHRLSQVRAVAGVLVAGLLGQLLLGLANTFWLSTPDSGSAWQTARPSWLLAVHITLGVGLFALALWAVRLAWRPHDGFWLGAAVVGLLGIVAGFVGGIVFMGEVSDNLASYSMAVGATVAVAAYAVGLYRLPTADAG